MIDQKPAVPVVDLADDEVCYRACALRARALNAFAWRACGLPAYVLDARAHDVLRACGAAS
eukprot:2134599-Pleurochrysis_carterae.AAC.1